MNELVNTYSLAITEYQAKWQQLVAARHDTAFFAALQPSAMGWKVADRTEFDAQLAVLRPLCDQVHLGWVNERWIATLHLKDQPLAWNIAIVKIMERRPGSTDAVGLDHVDFYVPDVNQARQVVAGEPDIRSTFDTSNPYCDWLSIWFADTEAKLRSTSVIEVCIAELQHIQSGIKT